MKYALCALIVGCLGVNASRAQELSLSDSDLILQGPLEFSRASSLAGVGDIDGDGRDELLVGSRNCRDYTGVDKDTLPHGQPPGCAFLIWGSSDLSSPLDLASPGSAAVRLVAGSEPGNLGQSVTGLGDFNGDGIPDFAVSAPRAGAGGIVHVVFGTPGLPPVINLSESGPGGLRFIGEAGSLLGTSIASAGDVNGDGLGDLIIGAPHGKQVNATFLADPDHHQRRRPGTAYVIFGRAGWSGDVDILDLGTDGQYINGTVFGEDLGTAVGGAGDLDGDGYDEVVVGAPSTSPAGRTAAGQAHVIFGSSSPAPFVSVTTPGAGVMTVNGARMHDQLGRAVAGAGDFNHDGIADLILGAERSSVGTLRRAGRAYVIWGSNTRPVSVDLVAPSIDLLEISGDSFDGFLGNSVAAAGDFDQDGIDDILLGATKRTVDGRAQSGRAYLIRGQENPGTSLSIAALGPGDGVTFNGIDPGDLAGHRVRGTGDFNGDGAPDLGIAASSASPPGRQGAGEFYLVYGTPLLAPGDLACEVDGITRQLSWTLASEYDEIRILRNGQPLVTLPGDAVFHLDPDPVLGLVTYEVIGLRGSLSSLPATCSVSVALQPPFNLRCEVIEGDVVLSWEHRHPLPVEGTRVFRDGTLIAELPGDTLSYVDPAPAPGVHVYSIRDFIGDDSSSDVECEVRVPRAPASLTCTVDGEDVTLEWINLDDFTSVKIFRDDQPSPVAILTSGSLESFVDRGLEAGAHVYRVQGCIDEDASAAATCSVTVFTAVTSLSGSSEGPDVTLTWDPPAVGGDGFLLFRDGELLAELPPGATSYLDPGLEPGDYLYEIFVFRGDDVGPPASVTVPVVRSVSDLEGCSEDLAVVVTWTLEDTYDSLELYRDGVLLDTLPGSAVQATDTLPAPSDSVYSIIGARGTGRSLPAEATVVYVAPPEGLFVILTDGTLHVGWSNPVAYDEILVTVNGELRPVLPGSETRVSYPADGLGEASVTVRGRVANTECQNVSAAAVDSASVVGGPRDLTCESSGLESSLAWTPGGSYPVTIERNGEVIHETAPDVNEYADTLPGPGTYTYRITGLVEGVPTLAAECTLEVPATVEDLQCESTGGGVELSWTLVGPHEGVRIDRDGELLVELAAGAQTYLDATAPAGLHVYEVRLTSSTSSGLPATCEVQTLLPPEITSCASEAGRVFLNISLPTPAPLIFVFRDGEEITPAGGLEVTGNEIELLDEPGLPGTYCYEAIAVSAGGSESAPSEPCCSEIPAPPVQLSCTALDAATRLTWVLNRNYDAIEVFRDEVLVDTLAGNATLYDDPDAPLPAGDYRYEIRGVVGDSVSESVACELTISPPVTDLLCVQDGDAIVLTWTLDGPVPGIFIRRNGEPIVELDGTATEYRDEGLDPNVYSYQIRTGTADVLGVPVECAVDMIDPISDLACERDGTSVSLTWTPGDLYDTILLRILVDEALQEEQELAGNAASITLEDLSPGSYRFELVGTLGESTSSPTSCEVEVRSPAFDLGCQSDRTDVTVTWQNGEPYDEIAVVRTREEDGEVQVYPGLPGSTQSFVDSGLANGTYSYVIEGTVGGVTVSSEPCQVSIQLTRFVRGEVNNDGRFDISDAVYILNWKFRGLPQPTCLDAADANDDGIEDLIDALHIINWQYRGGVDPEDPFIACGIDPTDDDPLDCVFFPAGSCP